MSRSKRTWSDLHEELKGQPNFGNPGGDNGGSPVSETLGKNSLGSSSYNAIRVENNKSSGATPKFQWRQYHIDSPGAPVSGKTHTGLIQIKPLYRGQMLQSVLHGSPYVCCRPVQEGV